MPVAWPQGHRSGAAVNGPRHGIGGLVPASNPSCKKKLRRYSTLSACLPSCQQQPTYAALACPSAGILERPRQWEQTCWGSWDSLAQAGSLWTATVSGGFCTSLGYRTFELAPRLWTLIEEAGDKARNVPGGERPAVSPGELSGTDCRT
ncbi:hypothetical protein SCUP515_05803 [Seiridium cupressi]